IMFVSDPVSPNYHQKDRGETKMGKSSRRKRMRREERRRSSPVGLGLKAVPNPFNGIPEERLQQKLSELADQHATQFPTTGATIQSFITRLDPYTVLACLAGYGLTNFIDAAGSIAPNRINISAAHVELTQAIALSLAPSNFRYEPPTGKDIGTLFELLPQWCDQFHGKRLAQLRGASSEAERRRLAVQEQVRT